MAYLPNEDRLTKALNHIDWEHHMVHRKKTFTVSYISLAVANNGYLDIHLTGFKNDAHTKITFSSEGKAYFKTYSGTTYTSAGTAYTPFNRCICSTTAATTIVGINPTINVLGSLRGNDFVGITGAAVIRAGGTGGESIETIINPGYDLLLRLQNVSGTTADLNMVINFYELSPDED